MAISPVVPNARATPVNDVTIMFSKPVYFFTLADLQLTNGSGPNLLSTGSPTLTSTNQVAWTLGNLAGLTGTNGSYDLTLSPTGIEDGAGNSLAVGAQASFAVDTTPAVSFADASETLSETAGTFSIAVNLSTAATANVSIPFALGGTAISGTDYTVATTSPILIPAGQTSATITGTLIDFGTDDVLRTVTFTLGSPTNATLGSIGTNTLTIAEVPLITWPNPADITYGATLSSTQLDAAATVMVNGSSVPLSGTFSYTLADGTTPAPEAVLQAGQDQALNVTFTPTPTLTADYTTAAATAFINVNRASQTITFTAPTSPISFAPNETVTLDASASSGATVAFSIDPTGTGLGSISGDVLTITAGGSFVLDANQAGNSNYGPAAQVQQTLVVNPINQTITFIAPSSPISFAPNETVTLNASANSGGTVAFSIDASSTGSGSVSGNILTVTGAGTFILDANQAGNSSYNAAPQVQQTLVVKPASQTINFTAPSSPIPFVLNKTVTLNASSSSGCTVAFSIDASSTGSGTISGDVLTITGAGSFVLDANQGGNGNYQAAPQVQQTLVVNKASQTINFTAPTSPIPFVLNETVTLSATSSSGCTVAFSIDGTSTGSGSISGDVLTITGAGSFVLDANQAGNGNYQAAPQVQQTLVVKKASQTINFTAPSSPINFVPNETVTLSASSSSGGTVAFSIDASSTGSGSISGNVLTITGAGSFVLDANQAGNGNYQAAAQVQQTLVVNPATVPVDVTPPTSKVNTLSVNQSSDTFAVTVTSSDPVGANNAPPSGVATVDLYYSTNGGTTWSLYQNLPASLAAAPGFSFKGQDRTTYDFYSVAHDVAGNTQIEPTPPTIQASTQVPEIYLPVSHVLAASPASQAWSPFPSSDFSSLQPSTVNLTSGTITLNWAAVEPDHVLNTPAVGTIQNILIYVEVDSGAATLVKTFSAGSPNANGVYSGSISYGMLGDGSSHTYSFYSVASDDYGKSQLAPPTPDVVFTATYSAVPAPTAFMVDNQSVQGESFIGSLAVTFNQPTANLSKLNTAVNTTKNVSGYVELLYYGKSLTGSSPVKTTVVPPAADVAFANSGGYATLSLNFGTGGFTSLFGGSATTNADDGWYLLGIDPYDNPSQNVVFWEPFYRLLGDVTGVGTVSGGVTTAGSDVNLVYYAKGSSQVTGPYDVDGSGLLSNTQVAEVNGNVGATVGTTKPTPPASGQFQLFAGAAGPGNAAALTQTQVQPVLAEAIASWKAVGVNAAGMQLMEQTRIEVTDLGGSMLGLEVPGQIWINSTAAGYSWYIGGGAASLQAFGIPGPGGEMSAGPAAGQVDLLTVLEHELGHIIGLGDNGQSGDLMGISLGLGIRRMPTAADVAELTPDLTTPIAAPMTSWAASRMAPADSSSVVLGDMFRSAMITVLELEQVQNNSAIQPLTAAANGQTTNSALIALLPLEAANQQSLGSGNGLGDDFLTDAGTGVDTTHLDQALQSIVQD